MRWHLVDGPIVGYAQHSGRRILPFVVDYVEMTKMIDLGVDGIITDFPGRLDEL